MRERYQPLSSDATVFRTVKCGGGYLPDGHKLPKPDWLEPTTEDVAEARQTGRAPGLSVWDIEYTTFSQACTWRDTSPETQRAFSATVGNVRRVAQEHGRELDVVSDPLDVQSPLHAAVLESLLAEERPAQEYSAQGHALAEGIKRPASSDRTAHRKFRAELADMFEPLAS